MFEYSKRIAQYLIKRVQKTSHSASAWDTLVLKILKDFDTLVLQYTTLKDVSGWVKLVSKVSNWMSSEYKEEREKKVGKGGTMQQVERKQ